MTRSMATHNPEKCGGLRAHCIDCLNTIWNGREPVTTEALDRVINVLMACVLLFAPLYLLWHVLRVVR